MTTERPAVLRAGVIGLGMIGGGVATCLARSGQLAGCYDIRPGAAAAFAGVPPQLPSPASVGECADVILIAVVNARQVRDVLSEPNGLLAVARPGQIFVVLATVSVEELANLRAMAAPAGVSVLDCGVIGGAVAAEKGLVSLVGAEPADMERVRPVLDGFSKLVIHAGGPGSGMALKVAFNMTVYGMFRAAYESAQLARAVGVDVHQLVEAMEASTQVFSRPGFWLARPDPRQDPVERDLRASVLGFLEKDLDAAFKLAAESGLDMPAARLARQTGRTVLGLEE